MILLRFGRWYDAYGSHLVWHRIYWKGYRWTPFCHVRRRGPPAEKDLSGLPVGNYKVWLGQEKPRG